ncbi:MAG TPA: hypothetical protein VFA78_07390, partial [Chloroflexota bacterium]|nr:hypothetical protein [Chloroflexota bacterium]
MNGNPSEPRILWPGNRRPVCVLLDDPTPCRNPAWHEFPEQGNVAVVPNSFTERFADLIDRTGAAGKFSVIPSPGAKGRIDQGLPGIAPDELAGFIGLVRDRIAPRWDISPEMITHNKAMDLETWQPLEEREDVWGAHQDEETLTRYISRALELLRNVGLEPNGVTSPWQFGIEIEDTYVKAIERALRDVCNVKLGWYFLHVDDSLPPATAVPKRLDAQAQTALVSLISGSAGPGVHDFAWPTQRGQPAETDALLSSDRSTGRLAEIFSTHEPMLFHTHWQSLFSNGSGAGLAALGVLFDRINGWGDQIRWTPARELATYAAAREATRIDAEGNRLRFEAPFACREFTVSVAQPAGTHQP